MPKTYSGFVSEARDARAEKYDRMRGMHGPIMKGDEWIKPDKLENLVKHPEIVQDKYGDGHKTLYIGHHKNAWTGKQVGPNVAILSHEKPNPDSITSKNSKYSEEKIGYNKDHSWYEDTGQMSKEHPSTSLVITGHAHIQPEGKVEYHGYVDPKAKHRLWVYK